MPETYDVILITVRPGTHPQALAVLGKSLADDQNLLACWYSDIGAVNQILIIRKSGEAAATLDARFATKSAVTCSSRTALGRPSKHGANRCRAA